MNSDLRLLTASALAAVALSGCATGGPNVALGLEAASLGEASRQTLAAQVIDPDPVYETVGPEGDGEHTADAIQRYHDGTVIKPVSQQTSSLGGATGGAAGPR